MHSDRKNERSACSIKMAPVPEFVSCPVCGQEVEFWTDEEDTSCEFCGHRLFRHERTVH